MKIETELNEDNAAKDVARLHSELTMILVGDEHEDLYEEQDGTGHEEEDLVSEGYDQYTPE